MDSEKTLQQIELQNPQLTIDDRVNDGGITRIAAAFDSLVRQLPDNAVMLDQLEGDMDVVMSPGEVLYGVDGRGCEAVIIGTGVQPFLVARDGYVEVPSELAGETPTDFDRAPYDEFMGILEEHAKPEYVPARNEFPGDDEDLAEEDEFEEPSSNFDD